MADPRPSKEEQILGALRRAGEQMDAARRRRDLGILVALDEGLSERQIGAAAGLSGPRINQIRQKDRAALAADTGQQVESPVRPSKGEGDMAAGLRMAGFPDPRIAELAVTVERLTGALEAIVQGYDRGHILGSDLILQARAALHFDEEQG